MEGRGREGRGREEGKYKHPSSNYCIHTWLYWHFAVAIKTELLRIAAVSRCAGMFDKLIA